jgi:5-(carboxyamino)imidazole ribonucleotide synthase
MENLIGDEIDTIGQIATEPGAVIHHYGKAEARPGRKMGHVTRINQKTASPR